MDSKIQLVKRASFLLVVGMLIGMILCSIVGAVLYFEGSLVLYILGFKGGEQAATATGIILMIIGLGCLISVIVLFAMYLYRAWLAIQPHHVSLTPGIAVGLCFVPVFNLYWVFKALLGWARDYNRVVAANPVLQSAPRASEALFLTFCVLGVISFFLNLITNLITRLGVELQGIAAITALIDLVNFVILLVCLTQICAAVNFFANFYSLQSEPDQRAEN